MPLSNKKTKKKKARVTEDSGVIRKRDIDVIDLKERHGRVGLAESFSDQRILLPPCYTPDQIVRSVVRMIRIDHFGNPEPLYGL